MIAYITKGISHQIISYLDYSQYIDQMIYLDNIDQYNLNNYQVIIIADGTHYHYLDNYQNQILNYINNGGFLIAFGCMGIEKILQPVCQLEWKNHRIKDWKWWMKDEKKIEIHQLNHSICNAIPIQDMSWHWHGVYDNHSACNILMTDDGYSIMLDFNKLEKGRVLLSTLDPHSHNGQRFMPATTRFLNKFYPWLENEIANNEINNNMQNANIQNTSINIQHITPQHITPHNIAQYKTKKQDFTFLYIQSYNNPLDMECFPPLSDIFNNTDININFCPLDEFSNVIANNADVIYIPSMLDQFLLQKKEGIFMDFLKNNGQIIACTETAIPWLPFLKPFQAINPKPYTNTKIKIKNDIYKFFENMPNDFDAWDGVLGQYARGWSEMPDGAVCITTVGNNKPSDWLYQLPTTTHGIGGKIFVHNGDNMYRYPDHGEHKMKLIKDISCSMFKNRNRMINKI